MPVFHKLLLILKAWRQLDRRQLLFYAKYQFKLRSGILRLQTPAKKISRGEGFEIKKVITPASGDEIKKLLGNKFSEVLAQADEVLNGQVRLFASEPRMLEIRVAEPLRHWTHYHSHKPDGSDIKPIWETGRLGWATLLARAFWLSSEEKYADGFWRLTEQFLDANPPNLGPHWSSAQEVALRLVSLAFCYSLVAEAKATTTERLALLGQNIIMHAERIVPTLDYAQAQNNNHLLSEALGLCTAAAMLPEHPRATKWMDVGSKYFFEGIESQIHDDGSYMQHSTNYHRLMLQLGLWATKVIEDVPQNVLDKLSKTADWLLKLLDKESGQVPNLGPNDGAYILPLSVLPFGDFRPVLQAVSLAFLGEPALPRGLWDEMTMWLRIKSRANARVEASGQPLRLQRKNSWAYFRVAKFRERPGHADQLHVDLWWRGYNIARDAGSYLYTAPAPWNNALASARVHNTVTVNDREPMTRAGKFLWLDWSQGKVVSTKKSGDGNLIDAIAEHGGYQKIGITHRREVSIEANRWVISDRLRPLRELRKKTRARLHWLLPDWEWQLDAQELRLESPLGTVEITVDASVGDQCTFQLIRAGELVHGVGETDSIMGWVSPTYGIKEPALSFITTALGELPITMTTTFTLPK